MARTRPSHAPEYRRRSTEPLPRSGRLGLPSGHDGSSGSGQVESRRHLLRQLRAFCHVARLGSISRAAERIYSSQPAVSVQIRALEDMVDLALFERNGPNIALTPVGREFYRLALPLVDEIDRLPDTFAEQHRHVAGDVHVAAGDTSAAVLLPEYLKRFAQRHPDSRVNVRTGTGRECLQWLRAYEVDLVVAAMDVEPSDLNYCPVVSAGFVLITPEDHPLAGRESATLEDLGEYPLIAHTEGTHARQFGEMLIRQHGIPHRVDVEVDGWDAVKAYVAAGLGISVVPDLCLSDRDRVWRIPFGEHIPPRTYGAVTRRERFLPLAVREIIRIMDPAAPVEP